MGNDEELTVLSKMCISKIFKKQIIGRDLDVKS